jgi:hypothetical protein
MDYIPFVLKLHNPSETLHFIYFIGFYRKVSNNYFDSLRINIVLLFLILMIIQKSDDEFGTFRAWWWVLDIRIFHITILPETFLKANKYCTMNAEINYGLPISKWKLDQEGRHSFNHRIPNTTSRNRTSDTESNRIPYKSRTGKKTKTLFNNQQD